MSNDTLEMKDYKETLSTFDGEYYKNLVGDVQEKVERYNEIGQVCRVSLRWRGKYYHLQLFFPGTKFPSRKEVETQVNKIYPDAVVMIHYASESQPNKPLVRVSENTEERNPNTGLPAVKETKNEDKSKGNINDPDLRRLVPEGVLDVIKKVTKKKDAPKHDYGKDAGAEAAKKLRNKEKNKYVNDISDMDEEKKLKEPFVPNKHYKGNPKGTPKKPKAGDRRPGVTEDTTYNEFMKRIEKLPDDTRKAIENCGNDPLVAKAALEISGMEK